MVQKTAEDRALDKIMTVFDGPSVEALERRVRVLFNLAKDCKNGAIIELGTYHGYGAFALAYGIKEGHRDEGVFTVDDYIERKGWAGEPYGESDFSVFNEKRSRLDLRTAIAHIRKDAIEAAELFEDGEVGLLYIDTGQIEVLPKIFDAWKDKVMDCGIVAFRDTLNRALECDKIASKAILSGKFSYLESPDLYFILLKRVA